MGTMASMATLGSTVGISRWIVGIEDAGGPSVRIAKERNPSARMLACRANSGGRDCMIDSSWR